MARCWRCNAELLVLGYRRYDLAPIEESEDETGPWFRFGEHMCPNAEDRWLVAIPRAVWWRATAWIC